MCYILRPRLLRWRQMLRITTRPTSSTTWKEKKRDRLPNRATGLYEERTVLQLRYDLRCSWASFLPSPPNERIDLELPWRWIARISPVQLHVLLSKLGMAAKSALRWWCILSGCTSMRSVTSPPHPSRVPRQIWRVRINRYPLKPGGDHSCLDLVIRCILSNKSITKALGQEYRVPGRTSLRSRKKKQKKLAVDLQPKPCIIIFTFRASIIPSPYTLM